MKIPVDGGQKLWENRKRDGAKAIIVNGGRVLLLKRRNVPFIINPGIWTFVGGRREEGETYLETAYREVREETGIDGSDLRLASRPKMMTLINVKKPSDRWNNMVFVFISRTRTVRLDMENADYRWASFNELKEGERFTNEFVKKNEMIRMVKRALALRHHVAAFSNLE